MPFLTLTLSQDPTCPQHAFGIAFCVHCKLPPASLLMLLVGIHSPRLGEVGKKTRRHRQLWLWFVGWTTSSGPSRFSPQVRMLRGVGRIPEFQAFSPPRTKVQEAEVLRHLGLKSQAQLSHGGKGSDDFIPARAPVRPLPPAACQPVSLRVVNRPPGI